MTTEVSQIECLHENLSNQLGDIKKCSISKEQLNNFKSLLDLKNQNLMDLYDIQEVISFEEGHILNLDQVLHRVLSFYNSFVPFRDRKIIPPETKQISSKVM